MDSIKFRCKEFKQKERCEETIIVEPERGIPKGRSSLKKYSFKLTCDKGHTHKYFSPKDEIK